MKKVLAVVLAAAFLGIGAMSADAQTPNVAVYFDDLLQETSKDCPPGTPGTVLDEAYVVCNNFGIFLIALEYQITFPPSVIFLGDDPQNTNVPFLGSSPAGIAIAWDIPQNAFDPFIANIITFVWNCDGCGATEPIVVGPNPQSNLLRGVEWLTQDQVIAVGMTSLVCPGTVSTEESTWGKVKALYNE